MRDKLIELMRSLKNACARRWAEFVASQKFCNTCAHRSKTDADSPCNRCFGCDEWEAPKTNGDKIRAMTDEELADFLCNNTECGSCKFGHWTGCTVREWLKLPVGKEL